MLQANRPSLELTLPEGVCGVRETMKIMRLILREAKKNDTLRQLAARVTSSVDDKDWLGEIGALFDFVQKNIRYQRDVTYHETLSTPLEVLLQGFGDCDDQALLLATLLESIGHDTRFTAMGFDQRGHYSHIIAEALLGENWARDPVITLDTTEDRPMGWRPPKVWRQMIIYNGDGAGD